MSSPLPTPEEERLFLMIETMEQLLKQAEAQQRLSTEQLDKFNESLKNMQLATSRHFHQCKQEYADLLQNIVRTLANQTHHTIKNSVKDVIDEGIGKNLQHYDEQAKKGAVTLLKTVKEANDTVATTVAEYKDWFGFKVLAVWGGGIFIVSMIALIFFVLYVPSRAEIAELRAEKAGLEKTVSALHIRTATCDGQPCVKVDTQQCGFGASNNKRYSYCVQAY